MASFWSYSDDNDEVRERVTVFGKCDECGYGRRKDKGSMVMGLTTTVVGVEMGIGMRRRLKSQRLIFVMDKVTENIISLNIC